ncbi:MAG: hypothetical protein U9M89_02800 [Patescibacteria group bacterium]|nr:hypothetical protein [Patescibacteria group bacterium]
MREKDKKELNGLRHINDNNRNDRNLSVVGEDVNNINKNTCDKQPPLHLYSSNSDMQKRVLKYNAEKPKHDMQKRVKAQGLLSKKKTLESKLSKIASTLKQEEIREHAKTDFYYFCKHIMGFSDMYRPLHEPLCKFVSNQKSKRKLLLIPRGHFKSTIGSICYPIWKLLNDNDERISLASVTSTLAENNLREIVSRIDYSKFQMLFSNDLPASSTWLVKRAFEAMIPRQSKKTGPSLFSTSVESSETGRHFSTIIIDDMVDDEKTRSRGQLERIWDWFGRQESVLDPSGEFLVIGCLTADSKVLMGDGCWKNINTITPGEEVWTFNKKEKQFYAGPYEYRFPEKQKVDAMIPQGEAEVFEVKTTKKKLKATGNHPFLVIKGKNTEWVKAEDLNVGDKVVTLYEVATDFSWKRVESVKPVGKEEVYDLAVANNHNFIANGLVVHNTHWHHDDPYSRIRKLQGWDKMILSVYKENGDLIFPTLFTKEKLETIRKSQGDYRFSCFYLNNPTGQGVNPFNLQKCSWVDYKTTPEAWTYILVDPATTTNEWSCPSGFVIGDALSDETFVVTESLVEKFNPDELIDKIISLANIHRPREIIIETDSAHRTFLYWVKEKMRNKKMPYVVKGMRNPTNMNKETRTIVELQPRLHEGKVLFSNDMKGRDVLLDEISTFPKGRHDDALQALAAVRMVSYPKGTRKKSEKVLDRRTVIFNNMIERNGRKRSRKKRPMPKSRVWG